MGRVVGWVGVCLVVVVAAILDFYDPHPPGWEITAAERADIEAGGWKDALDPIESIPIDPKLGAEEVAARLAVEYCSERSTSRLEKHDTDHDFIIFVPSCIEIDEPESRLEAPEALLEVHMGEPPIVGINGVHRHSCMVNAGARYQGHGTCIRDLLNPGS